MKHRSNDTKESVGRPDLGRRIRLCSAIAVSVMLCLVVSLYLVASYVSPAFAARNDVPSISSSPSAGPVGAVVTVSGSGWFVPDGTPVAFGFSTGFDCNIVSDAQPGTR